MKRSYFYLSLLIIIAAFTLYEELSFRRYLFHNHFNIIAGSLPNFLSALLFTFAVVIVRKQYTNSEALKTSIAAVSGLILYEVAQIWIPGRVFDSYDIIASIAGGVVAYGLICGVNKLT